ncbi:RNA-binding protein 25-like [Palaemon carinicauda]|uniref:RNA-binding protein 25-like n=1 Tax=Palaemon carinicauda TaxID=392227 RepID=UPI0035B5C82D
MLREMQQRLSSFMQSYQAPVSKRVAVLDPEHQEASLLDARRRKTVSQEALNDDLIFVSPLQGRNTVPLKESELVCVHERQTDYRSDKRQADRRNSGCQARDSERSTQRDVKCPVGRVPERVVKCAVVRDLDRPSIRGAELPASYSIERPLGRDLERSTKNKVEYSAKPNVELSLDRGAERPLKRKGELHSGRELERPTKRDVERPKQVVERPSSQDVNRPSRLNIECPQGRVAERQAAKQVDERQAVRGAKQQAAKQVDERQAVRGAERQSGSDVKRFSERDPELPTSSQVAGDLEVSFDYEDEYYALQDDTDFNRDHNQEHVSSDRFDRMRFDERQAVGPLGDRRDDPGSVAVESQELHEKDPVLNVVAPVGTLPEKDIEGHLSPVEFEEVSEDGDQLISSFSRFEKTYESFQ